MHVEDHEDNRRIVRGLLPNGSYGLVGPLTGRRHLMN